MGNQIARTKNPGGLCEARNFGDGFGDGSNDGHYSILQNVGDYVQVPTQPAIAIAKGRYESEPIPRDSAAGNRLQLATTPGAAQCSR